jgi:hypothetical protein
VSKRESKVSTAKQVSPELRDDHPLLAAFLAIFGILLVARWCPGRLSKVKAEGQSSRKGCRAWFDVRTLVRLADALVLTAPLPSSLALRLVAALLNKGRKRRCQRGCNWSKRS